MYMYGLMTELNIQRKNKTVKGHKKTNLLKKQDLRNIKVPQIHYQD